jgi:orotate phosphoribosyltransferase
LKDAIDKKSHRVYAIAKRRFMRDSNFQKMLSHTGAMLSGHFLLSSGLHSGQYLQCALLLSYPGYTASLCKALAGQFKKDKIDIVAGPAYGGIIIAYELARALKARAIFTERKDGLMQLRRGFSINKGQRVLIAEDVITTGKSVKEVIKTIRPYKPKIAGVAGLIDRSGRKNPFGAIRFESVKKINIKIYTPAQCPLCKANMPLVKPGSRTNT